MTTFHKRMKHGLRWSDHRAPGVTIEEIAAAVFAALIVTAGYLYVSYQDAQAGMMEAQARQVKAELSLIALLSEEPLILDKDSGMVALAKIETYGEQK